MSTTTTPRTLTRDPIAYARDHADAQHADKIRRARESMADLGILGRVWIAESRRVLDMARADKTSNRQIDQTGETK